MNRGELNAQEMLSQVSTASLSTQLVKRGFRTRAIAGIHALNPKSNHVFGPAYTLRYIPMREDLATGPKMGRADNPQRHACLLYTSDAADE